MALISSWTSRRTLYIKMFYATLLLMCLVAASTVESKVIDCSPLPECCRTFVFSPGCRGVAAKRNGPASIQRNSHYQREPRLVSVDPDYGNDNLSNLAAIVKSLALANEDSSPNHFEKTSLEAQYDK
ncbi:uncharacterized protein LOC109544715 [Dendroctonus ponderosae]|uniref:uncharacterized protein LOC109544715 n=1 Tax=Dendroctonus ponderosae TaxID=77166 RepID=UPI0020352AB9|nr:uncharacterized protein LOC109544715 [Dendroctonus ponderosae]